MRRFEVSSRLSMACPKFAKPHDNKDRARHQGVPNSFGDAGPSANSWHGLKNFDTAAENSQAKPQDDKG